MGSWLHQILIRRGGGETDNMMTGININIMYIPPQVLLVTGGSNGVDIDTTEIYRPGSDTEWQVISSARLPRPMWGVRVTTLDSRVILFGELCYVVIFILSHTSLFYRWI